MFVETIACASTENGLDRCAAEFGHRRSNAGDDGRPVGLFRISFDRPVVGPIALGYHSHFGMGLFRPAEG